MIKISGLFKEKILRDSLQLQAAFKRAFSSKQKKENEDACIITKATKDDTNPILDLMWKSYYPNEPLTASIGLGKSFNTVFDEDTSRALSEGVSMVARNKTDGRLVGASINESTTPWDPNLTDHFASSIKCPKIRQLYRFKTHIHRIPNLWEAFNVKKVFEISCVFVKESERGKGIAYELVKSSRNLGFGCGYNVIRFDATNNYAAKICEKLKMQLVQEIPYCSYVGDDHQPIFVPSPPHTSLKIYVDLPHAWEEQRKKFYKKK